MSEEPTPHSPRGVGLLIAAWSLLGLLTAVSCSDSVLGGLATVLTVAEVGALALTGLGLALWDRGWWAMSCWLPALAACVIVPLCR